MIEFEIDDEPQSMDNDDANVPSIVVSVQFCVSHDIIHSLPDSQEYVVIELDVEWMVVVNDVISMIDVLKVVIFKVLYTTDICILLGRKDCFVGGKTEEKFLLEVPQL